MRGATRVAGVFAALRLSLLAASHLPVSNIARRSCESSQVCQDQGWSVLLRGVQATIGDVENAMSEALQLPKDVFVR